MPPGDPNSLIDGYSLSYDPVSGIDNKTGLQFAWQCQTFSTTDIDELVAISSQPLPAKLSSNCDDISTEVFPGQRRLNVGGWVMVAGYLFKVRMHNRKIEKQRYNQPIATHPTRKRSGKPTSKQIKISKINKKAFLMRQYRESANVRCRTRFFKQQTVHKQTIKEMKCLCKYLQRVSFKKSHIV